MLKRILISTAFVVMTSTVEAQPFDEVTVGLAVPSLEEAVSWYTAFLGPDVEMIRPVPTVVEFRIAPGVWLQLFEVEDGQPTNAIVRFLIDDFDVTQNTLRAANINSGEAIVVPDVVTFSEFADPYGNALGLYALP